MEELDRRRGRWHRLRCETRQQDRKRRTEKPPFGDMGSLTLVAGLAGKRFRMKCKSKFASRLDGILGACVANDAEVAGGAEGDALDRESNVHRHVEDSKVCTKGSLI